MRATLRLALAAALLGCHSLSASAQIQELNLKFIGQSSIESNSSLLEKPFFQKMGEASGGKIKVDLQPFNTLGLSGAEILRLMKTGTIEWASNGLTFLSGDKPEFEGCDLAGITKNIEIAYKACASYKPVIAKLMADNWNVKLLALYGNPPQVVWCRTPIKSLADLKGKKIRVFNKTMTDFAEGVGGTAVTIPFADVVPALQRGVADCAMTGTFNGNIAGWPEVAPHILGVYLGWALQYAAVNLDTWKKASITFINPTGDDEKERIRIMQESVLPRWAKRCGAKCAEEWNATVGKVVDLKAPTN